MAEQAAVAAGTTEAEGQAEAAATAASAAEEAAVECARYGDEADAQGARARAPVRRVPARRARARSRSRAGEEHLCRARACAPPTG